MNKPVIKIDIVSDVVCPWCYIGKIRLEKALSRLNNQYEFNVAYHPFELNPAIPEAGLNQKEYLTKKFGGEDRYNQLTKNVASVALQEGLNFDLENQRISPNTLNIHRIINLAKEYKLQQQVVHAFFSAFFEQGVDLTKNENLIKIATSAGLNETLVKNLLASDNGKAEVMMAEKEMQAVGITGVPFYIIDGKHGVSGAQPAETFISILQDIGSKIEVSSETCDVETKNC